MISARIPPDEARRLARLVSLEILDTPGEERFDRITRLAARLLDTPIALVSLVDERRQWFKSVFGLDARETPRDVAFCAHAILDAEPLVVENALADPRFAKNPLVTGGPCIRFYAGAPLLVRGGSGVGTLCVIDTRPRVLDEAERQSLADLACIVETELRAVEMVRLIEALERARGEVDVLRAVVPICSYCRSVRKDADYWQSVENFIEEHLPAELSHGICPGCYRDVVAPQLDRFREQFRAGPADARVEDDDPARLG